MTASEHRAAWPPPDGAPSNTQIATVLLATGVIGFVLGLLWNPKWQDAVEVGQVVAGLVKYPPQNPIYLYSTRAWTVTHEIFGLLLYTGFTERTLSLVLDGIIGMVSMQALSVFVLAVSHDVPLAVLLPPFILFTNAATGGVTYGVALMGTEQTYGMLGFSYMLLTLSLIGAGQMRWGALLLGFGPAIHVSVGSWGIAVVTIAMAVSPSGVRRSALRTWPYLLTGMAAAGVAAAVHLALTALPPPDLYLAGLTRHWDSHRQPFALLSSPAIAVYFSSAIALLWSWRFESDLPASARVLLRMLVVAALLGGLLSASYWLVPAQTPNPIAALMPSRLLNLGIATGMALVIGLSTRYPWSRWIQSSVAVLVLVLTALAALLAPYDDGTGRRIVAWVAVGACGVMLAIVAELRRRGIEVAAGDRPQLRWLRRATIATLAVALTGVLVLKTVAFSQTVAQEFVDRTNNALLATASRRPGLLLTAGALHLVQLRARRPVLLDGGALDALLYVPDAEPEADRILRTVYGMTLRSIQDARRGWITDDARNRTVWEARSSAMWQAIGRQFGVTDVLTDPEWTLQLPLIASDSEFALYGIPTHQPIP